MSLISDLEDTIQNLSTTKKDVLSKSAQKARKAYLEKNNASPLSLTDRFLLGLMQGIGIGLGILLVSAMTVLILQKLGH